MPRFLQHLPALAVVTAIVALGVHGPIAQWPDYHAFADQREWLGIPRAADVLSNLAFLVAASWAALGESEQRGGDRAELWSRRTFIATLVLVAVGSTWYHWAPDNDRLVFDRLPIALGCASLLCAARARATPDQSTWTLPVTLICAVLAVLWWRVTDAHGPGDLRPYLLLQAAPLLLVPLWQWIHRRPGREVRIYGAAIALYSAAKVFELQDGQLLDATGIVSGHTVKHLLCALAAACVVASLKDPPPHATAGVATPSRPSLGFRS